MVLAVGVRLKACKNCSRSFLLLFSFARKKEAGVQVAEPLLSYRLICKEFPPPGTGRPKCW